MATIFGYNNSGVLSGHGYPNATQIRPRTNTIAAVISPVINVT